MNRQPVTRETQAEVMRRKGYVRVREASVRCNIPLYTIYQWVESGVVGNVRVGRCTIYVPLADMLRLAGAAAG